MDKDRWLEDFRPGETAEFGESTMTEAAMIAFATQFDPQVFHIDPREPAPRSSAASSRAVGTPPR